MANHRPLTTNENTQPSHHSHSKPNFIIKVFHDMVSNQYFPPPILYFFFQFIHPFFLSKMFWIQLKYHHWQLPYIDWSEVQNHQSEESCWLVVDGVVLDVSWFIHSHPAGKESILRHASTNATLHYNFHSNRAKKLWMLSHAVGRVKSIDPPKIIQPASPPC